MKRRKMLSLLSALGIITIGVAALLLLTSFRAEAKTIDKEIEARIVRTVGIIPDSQAVGIIADGFLRPAQSLEICSPVTGIVVSSKGNLKGGIRVEEGDLLLKLDDRRARLSFENSRSEMISIGSRFTTAAGLSGDTGIVWMTYLKSLGTADEYNLPLFPSLNERESLLAATMGVSAAQNKLISAAMDLQDHQVTAPFGGSLSGEGIAAGTRVYPGVPLVVLHETDSLELTLSLPANQLTGLEPGAEIVLYDDSDGRTGEASILRIEPMLSSGNQMAKIHAGIPVSEDNKWRPGAFVTARIQGPVYESAFRVPREALIDSRLPVLSHGVLSFLPVEILAFDSGDIIFRTDSTESIELVTTVLQNPVNGMPLRREAD